MRAIGFCHLLLQSRALVSRSFSTRSLPHARGLFRFPRSLPVPFFRRTEHSSTQRFHAAAVTVVDDRIFFLPVSRRSPNHCRACRASSMCQLADLSAAAHTSKLHLVRSPTQSVKTTPRCNRARLLSKGTFHRPSSCDVSRAPRGVDPMSRACPAFVGFAANVPSHCAVSPLRYRVAFANAIASARPPCTPACLIDADASLSQSQPFDFCNEFSKYDTRARILRALSSPAAGVGPAVVATHDALLTLPDSSSFGCKEGSSSMRRSELRVVFPDTHPREVSPRSPRASAPTSDTVQVDPQDMGYA
jgi:hypothetical protein